MTLINELGLQIPILQAPMAGVSTPKLAAAVSNASALGSIAIGATDLSGASAMIDELRHLTPAPFNVNVFVHDAPRRDRDCEENWLAALAPLFAEVGAEPPRSLRTIYKSFADDHDMLRLLVDRSPAVISFHFGLPNDAQVRALREAGCKLIATATSPDEARAAKRAGMDAVIAQGYEAGGHRGIFDLDRDDARLSTVALTQILVRNGDLPVIAAGGIMDGQGIRAVLDLGALAAQLGTAFIACPESAADSAYRAVLKGSAAHNTVMTSAISGRPARCISNRFTEFGETVGLSVPAYPVAYDAGKSLNAAAKAVGETRFGAQWAGEGAPFHRPVPAAELITLLRKEMGAPA